MPKGRELLTAGWTSIDTSSDEMLEAWMLFCIAVAGKTAKSVTKSINKFLEPRGRLSPFAYVRRLESNGRLYRALWEAKVGQYSKLTWTFAAIAGISPFELRNWTTEDFEGIKGIGPKTSRFFIQSTREGTRFAVLDTHVLAWMGEQGIDVPKSTPTGKKYAELEKKFLELCDRLGVQPRDLDAQIWLSRARI